MTQLSLLSYYFRAMEFPHPLTRGHIINRNNKVPAPAGNVKNIPWAQNSFEEFGPFVLREVLVNGGLGEVDGTDVSIRDKIFDVECHM